jgi:hypothetical protein
VRVPVKWRWNKKIKDTINNIISNHLKCIINYTSHNNNKNS